jgi:hypothetical protein
VTPPEGIKQGSDFIYSKYSIMSVSGQLLRLRFVSNLTFY